MKTGPKIIDPAKRFWPKVNKSGPIIRQELGPCWEWMAAREKKGYGKFGVSNPRRLVKASRFVWELERGPIPEGLWVLHRCDHPPCVNPAHLFLGTARDNNRDTASKGRCAAQRNPQRYAAALAKGRTTIQARAAARPDPLCVHCKRPARRNWKGRCHTCHEYWRRNGDDRPAALLKGIRGGELSGNARLTEANVRDIFRRVAAGERQIDLCRELGVARTVVCGILKGRSWKHLGLSLEQFR